MDHESLGQIKEVPTFYTPRELFQISFSLLVPFLTRDSIQFIDSDCFHLVKTAKSQQVAIFTRLSREISNGPAARPTPTYFGRSSRTEDMIIQVKYLGE